MQSSSKYPCQIVQECICKQIPENAASLPSKVTTCFGLLLTKSFLRSVKRMGFIQAISQRCHLRRSGRRFALRDDCQGVASTADLLYLGRTKAQKQRLHVKSTHPK